jgi:transcription initiation factor TFIIB
MTNDANLLALLHSLKSIESIESIDQNITDDCIYCKSNNIELIDGNYLCMKCNSVLERFIDMQAEWRYYGADDSKASDPTRCGMPCSDLLPNSSLGSIISNQNNESYDMKLIKKYHMWNSMSYKERTLYNIFDNITVHAVNNGIPASIIDDAKVYYKNVSDSRISRGDNRSGLIATAIYFSCKSNGVPRSTKEIAKIFNLKVTTMTRGCKKFQDILKTHLEASTPTDFIKRFCSKLNLNIDMIKLCEYVVNKAEEYSLVSENTPTSISSGCIYLVNYHCDLGLTKKDISDSCEISIVTLTKIYKKLYLHRDVLFPTDIIHKYNIK